MFNDLYLLAALVRPAIATSLCDAGGPYTVDAEGTVTLTGSVSSECTDTTYTWTINGVTKPASTSPSTTWTAAGIDGPSGIAVDLEVDCHIIVEAGDVIRMYHVTCTDSTSISVSNVPPTIEEVDVPSDLGDREEGNFTAVVHDVESADTLTVTWAFGDGSERTGTSVVHTYAAPGDYTITVTATDDDGGTDKATVSITVSDLSPVIGGTPPTTATVGEPYSFSPTVDSPASTDFAWTGQLPDGATIDAQTGRVDWVPSAQQVGDQNLSITVTDDAGRDDTLAWTVHVNPGDTGMDSGASGGDSAEPPSNDTGSDLVGPNHRSGKLVGCACDGGGGAGGSWLLAALMSFFFRRRHEAAAVHEGQSASRGASPAGRAQRAR